MLTDKIHVTDHALERWQERRAERMDAREDEVIAAVRSSHRLDEHDYLPGPRLDHTHYYHNPQHACWFVVEPVYPNSSRVVTVLVEDGAINPILPKVVAPEPTTQALKQPLDEITALTNRITVLRNNLGKHRRHDPARNKLIADINRLEVQILTIREERRKARAIKHQAKFQTKIQAATTAAASEPRLVRFQ